MLEIQYSLNNNSAIASPPPPHSKYNCGLRIKTLDISFHKYLSSKVTINGVLF